MNLRLTLLFFAVITACAGWAQEQTLSKPPSRLDQVYADYGFGAGLTSVGGFTYSTAIVISWPGGWGGALRLRVSDFPSVNEPLDYSPGLCLFGNCKPRDQVVSVIPAGRRLIRFGDGPFAVAVEAGPAFVFSSQRFFTPNTSGGWFGPSHTVSVKKSTGIGAAARVSMQLHFSRIFGLEFGAGGVVNPYRNTLSFDIALLLGLLQRRTPG